MKKKYCGTVGVLVVVLEKFAAVTCLLYGGEELVEEGELGMLSTFTGVGGALPERGREIPEKKKGIGALEHHFADIYKKKKSVQVALIFSHWCIRVVSGDLERSEFHL